MRQKLAFLSLTLLLLIGACTRAPVELRLANPGSPIDHNIAADLADLMARESELNLQLTETPLTEEGAIDSLLAGTIDVALISNNMPYREGIATVLPMYPTVLHVGYMGDREFSDRAELLRGAKVYAGSAGSASRAMFQQSIGRLDVREDEITYIDEPGDQPDVVVLFAPISPDRLREYPEFRMLGMGSPDSIGKGSIVDAAALLNPYLRPFVIPTGTYGESTPEPILTLAVDKILVARRDLDSAIVYDLVNELVRLRPALSAQRPGLFQNLSGDFDPSRSTFVLHPGAQDYLQRSAPTVYERYSGIAEVGVTILIAIFSAIFAGLKIFRMRRKNRIDTFYSETIRLRNSVTGATSDIDRNAIIGQIRQLQNTAFEMLVDEKLAADESFRIFVTLSNDVLEQLGKNHDG